MALHLSDQNVAHQIAERIRHLIARQDDGDVTIAARRLDRSIADVYFCERLISCDDEPAAVDFLATVVRSYDADAVWLITGRDARDDRTVTSEARGTIVEVLAELSDRLLDQVRSEREAPSRVSRRGPEPSPSSDSPYPHIPSPQ
jgi:hypothetical protein